jgi:chemotaxis protein CheX
MSYNEDINCIDDVLRPLSERAVSFLREDMSIEPQSGDIEISYPKRIELKKNTAMIGTGGSVKVIIAMGYDEPLLDKVVNRFLDGEEINPNEIDEIRESVSCEVVNIIVGNALINPVDNTTLSITPPVHIYEAKSLVQHKDSKIATAKVLTKFGDMLITVIGPRELFLEELDFKYSC